MISSLCLELLIKKILMKNSSFWLSITLKGKKRKSRTTSADRNWWHPECNPGVIQISKTWYVIQSVQAQGFECCFLLCTKGNIHHMTDRPPQIPQSTSLCLWTELNAGHHTLWWHIMGQAGGWSGSECVLIRSVYPGMCSFDPWIMVSSFKLSSTARLWSTHIPLIHHVCRDMQIVSPAWIFSWD